jgi:hypothetical protein
MLGEHKVKELQKSAILDTDGINQNKIGIWCTAHIFWKEITKKKQSCYRPGVAQRVPG